MILSRSAVLSRCWKRLVERPILSPVALQMGRDPGLPKSGGQTPGMGPMVEPELLGGSCHAARRISFCHLPSENNN